MDQTGLAGHDLRALVDSLPGDEAAYVMERAKVRTDRAAIEAAGVPRSTFYRWPEEQRDYLRGLAEEWQKDVRVQALYTLESAAQEAAQVKVDGLHSRKDNIRQDAASEVLDRVLGKPTQHIAQEVSGQIQVVKGYIGISPDDWDKDDDEDHSAV